MLISTLFPICQFQNFSVCERCSRLAQLYHKLHHLKHRMFIMCSEVVESKKNSAPEVETTRILNELLANDVWLEQVRDFPPSKFMRVTVLTISVLSSISAIPKDARTLG